MVAPSSTPVITASGLAASCDAGTALGPPVPGVDPGLDGAVEGAGVHAANARTAIAANAVNLRVSIAPPLDRFRSLDSFITPPLDVSFVFRRNSHSGAPPAQ